MHTEVALGGSQVISSGTIVQSPNDGNPSITFAGGTVELQFEPGTEGQEVEDAGPNHIRIKIRGSDQYPYYTLNYSKGINFGPLEIMLNVAVFYLATSTPLRVIHYSVAEV